MTIVDTTSDLSFADYTTLDNVSFAAEWKDKYQFLRTAMLPDVARWVRLLRYYHPRQLEDHWHAWNGSSKIPSPKLFKSKDLSVEIFNWCRPIIEVYLSLLSGQKPWPFMLDVPPREATLDSEVFRADAAEKVIIEEMINMKIPLHFEDFCQSVVMFGIGYAYSWLDPEIKRLKTRAVPWPGDVLPIWGSDRYGAGAEGMEACIMQERIPLETAMRLYPNKDLVESAPADMLDRPTSTFDEAYTLRRSVHVLKVWYRWDDNDGSHHVGYAEIAYDGVRDGDPVLYREDDTKYPDIPVIWAARVATPGEAPHQSAGVLDDVVGINAEYNEKLCALSDAILKNIYTKYKGKGMTEKTIPRMVPGSSIYPLGANQDLVPLIEQIGQIPFDSFLTRLETMMLSIAGLSRLMMGSLPPGETSGEALMNLLHAAIARLEVIRTPIQWSWVHLITNVWIPLLRDFGEWEYTDTKGRTKTATLDVLFEGINRVDWQWPDVTPRDALRAAELAMNLGRGGWLSDESVMKRAQIPSVVDELQKIRRQKQDIVMHPADVLASAGAKLQELQAKIAEMQATAAMQPAIPADTGNNVQDARNKMAAAKTPVLSEEDNAVAPGTPENAAQGIVGAAPEQVR
ncbi:MAG TPA: hypothetical protein VFK94_06375 [Patescibacteria group bacterium]|nr:hypothetical protein [Patescibacteria group bacterium]